MRADGLALLVGAGAGVIEKDSAWGEGDPKSVIWIHWIKRLTRPGWEAADLAGAGIADVDAVRG
jgi:hypothetical protein